MKRFPEKRIVITGAGSGFGRALAMVFAKKGWRIGVSDINEERADETVDMVNAAGGQGEKSICDVTKPDQVDAMARGFVDLWGGVDIIVNNAGVASGGYMDEVTPDVWQWMIDLDLMSVIYGCRTFIPFFLQQGSGHIVNMASSAGLVSLPEMGSYNVPKAGVVSLSETLRVELAPKKIGVTVLAPTFFKTNLMDQFKSPRQRQANMANAFFAKSMASADTVAKHAYKRIQKNKLYAVCQIDGKVTWMMKRWFPETYFRVAAMIYKSGIADKFLNAGDGGR
ncbi:MAG: SDR family oxidoreductase [Thermodesulfobacteriota bacterium]|nr:SDR family oxidoreductase [Thermodesulfobacteriota bacterium]